MANNNVGFILNSIVVANPVFFKNFHHVTEGDSILYFIEVINDHTIRLRERELKLLPEIVIQLNEHFEIVD